VVVDSTVVKYRFNGWDIRIRPLEQVVVNSSDGRTTKRAVNCHLTNQLQDGRQVLRDIALVVHEKLLPSSWEPSNIVVGKIAEHTPCFSLAIKSIGGANCALTMLVRLN
jgi:hypothetical protein